MKDPHTWAEQVSAVLRDRLMLNNGARPPSWMGELYERFAQFHVTWMRRSLEAGEPERLVGILSRISGWRMAQALLDEIDLAERKLPESVEAFRQCRREVHRLLRELQSLEGAGGLPFTDPSGPLRTGLRERSPALQARIEALRQEYDGAFNQMQEAQRRACQHEAYGALSGDLGFDHQALRDKLSAEHAAVVLVDMPGEEGSMPPLGGALVVRKDRVQWLPVEGLAWGRQYLQRFQTDFARGPGYRRGGAASDGLSGGADVLAEAGQYWPTLEVWVKETLWQALAREKALVGIQKVTLVTQGATHAVPWELGAPPALAIARYPGLMLFGMRCGMLASPANDDSDLIGIAAYEGEDLPYTRHEADLIAQDWAGKAVRPYSYVEPCQAVGAVHIAGHGSHSESAPQSAHLRVEQGRSWTLPDLLASPARPRQVFISTCVAGQTTESDEGELYGVVAALQQRGVQEIVAATVDMNDPWMMVLGMLTQRNVLGGMSLVAALAKAKEQVREGNWDAAATHAIWAGHIEQGIRATLERPVTPRMARAEIRELLGKHAHLLDLGKWTEEEAQAWLDRVLQSEGLQPAIVAINMLWRMTPPQPLLGSLLHAVIAFGEPTTLQ